MQFCSLSIFRGKESKYFSFLSSILPFWPTAREQRSCHLLLQGLKLSNLCFRRVRRCINWSWGATKGTIALISYVFQRATELSKYNHEVEFEIEIITADFSEQKNKNCNLNWKMQNLSLISIQMLTWGYKIPKYHIDMSTNKSEKSNISFALLCHFCQFLSLKNEIIKLCKVLNALCFFIKNILFHWIIGY